MGPHKLSFLAFCEADKLEVKAERVSPCSQWRRARQASERPKRLRSAGARCYRCMTASSAVRAIHRSDVDSKALFQKGCFLEPRLQLTRAELASRTSPDRARLQATAHARARAARAGSTLNRRTHIAHVARQQQRRAVQRLLSSSAPSIEPTACLVYGDRSSARLSKVRLVRPLFGIPDPSQKTGHVEVVLRILNVRVNL